MNEYGSEDEDEDEDTNPEDVEWVKESDGGAEEIIGPSPCILDAVSSARLLAIGSKVTVDMDNVATLATVI
jgi:hypothetical protein